jgi:alkyl sulfatase BDS1-like metallo-beta-lactamase superfamily hydrolase
MNAILSRLTLFGVISLLPFLVYAVEMPKPAAHPDLVNFNKKFETPRLVKMGERVHMAFGYDYANYGFIEGDDGIIVVDTGWHMEQTRPAWEDYRKITDKPVKAVIYTHMHGDHVGGIRIIVPESEQRPIPIYAHSSWEDYIGRATSPLAGLVVQRSASQMGMYLPEGLEGSVGSAVGAMPRLAGGVSFIEPTDTFDEELELEISGVRIKMIHAPGDTSGGIIVWLPDDKVMFGADSIIGIFPAIITPRHEPSRDPYDMVETLKFISQFPTEYLIPGHGRPVMGRKEVYEFVRDAHDGGLYLLDQTMRYMAMGLNADEIIDRLELPPHIANNPDLQFHYHRMEWKIRGIYAKYAGWTTTDPIKKTRLTDSEEAKRLVPLLGGVKATLKAAAAAYEDSDQRWAATLATLVLQVAPDNADAQSLKMSAYRAIAYNTRSANERHYLLTAANLMDGSLELPNTSEVVPASQFNTQTTSRLLANLGTRLNGRATWDEKMSVAVHIEGEADSYTLTVRRGVLVRDAGTQKQADATITVTRDALVSIARKTATWQTALDNGDINVDSGEKAFRRFTTFFEA